MKLMTKIHTKQTGFTIVELLIVIVVIAILASIVVLAYNGVRARAVQSSVKSDLQSNAKSAESQFITDGSYPANGAAFNQGQGLKVSGDNALSYTIRPYGFCLSGDHDAISPYHYNSLTGLISEGDCTINNSTFAGSGVAGFAEGMGTAAQFNNPNGIAIDSSGNLFVADSTNNRIRQITPEGDVTTFAGSGAFGFADDTGTAAEFGGPTGIAIDANDTLYVADYSNSIVRKITPGGVVSTLAGTAYVVGSVDGTGAAAQLAYPSSLAVGPDGMIYVTEASRIRKITPAGVVTTIAGSTNGFADGQGSAARFTNPFGIAVDGNGNLYVADTGNHRIRKVTSSGYVSTIAGGATSGFVDGAGTTARFNQPYGIAIDGKGALYVGDSQNHSVRAISPTRIVTTLGGNGSSGYADGDETVARYWAPGGIAVAGDGTVYITDGGNDRIRMISL